MSHLKVLMTFAVNSIFLSNCLF